MKRSKRVPRVKVSADGRGCGVPRGGRDAAGGGRVHRPDRRGDRRRCWTRTRACPVHAPGRVFTDLACAVADGADAISGIAVLGDRDGLVRSGRLDAHDVAAAGPHRRRPSGSGALARGPPRGNGRGPPARPRPPDRSCAWTSMPRSRSRTRRRSPRPRRGSARSGSTRCCASWTAPRSPAGKRWPGYCGPGTPGATPPRITSRCWTWPWRSCRRRGARLPGNRVGRGCWPGRTPPGRPTSSPTACVARGVEFSFGFPVDARIRRVVDLIPEHCWDPAIQSDEHLRDGAWVFEATGMVDLRSWPPGSRLILRKERPHPGAQLTFTDLDGMRITAVLTNTGPGVIPGQAAGLELRHRQHARVEDRIREAKATGLRNLPCHATALNATWLEVVLTADRPDHLDPADRLPRHPGTGPLRDPRVPLPGPARRRPDHPRRPTHPPTHRPALALGSPDRRRVPPNTRRVRLTHRATAPDPRTPQDPTRPRSGHHHAPTTTTPRKPANRTPRPIDHTPRERGRLDLEHRLQAGQGPRLRVAAGAAHRSGQLLCMQGGLDVPVDVGGHSDAGVPEQGRHHRQRHITPKQPGPSRPWRREWNGRSAGRSSSISFARNRRRQLAASRGVPTRLVNTSPVSGHPDPSARRRSPCTSRWALRMSTSSGIRGTARACPPFVDSAPTLERRTPPSRCAGPHQSKSVRALLRLGIRSARRNSRGDRVANPQRPGAGRRRRARRRPRARRRARLWAA